MRARLCQVCTHCHFVGVSENITIARPISKLQKKVWIMIKKWQSDISLLLSITQLEYIILWAIWSLTMYTLFVFNGFGYFIRNFNVALGVAWEAEDTCTSGTSYFRYKTKIHNPNALQQHYLKYLEFYRLYVSVLYEKLISPMISHEW